jgi:TetR/AcrR family transcriptional regulator
MTLRAIPQDKRRVGRPRKRDVAAVEMPPKAHILNVAAELFAARGIGEVSMLEIAGAVGLRQSSLYYWFRRKELIVAELLQQVNRLPLAFARQLSARGEGPDLQLYRLVRFDVHTVCTFPLEVTEVHRFSHRDPTAFETYWREREELAHTLERLIEQGVSAGCFLPVDAYLTSLTIIAQDESVQNWITRPARSEAAVLTSAGGRASTQYGAVEIAEFVATRTVASLLTDTSRLAALKARADME